MHLSVRRNVLSAGVSWILSWWSTCLLQSFLNLFSLLMLNLMAYRDAFLQAIRDDDTNRAVQDRAV